MAKNTIQISIQKVRDLFKLSSDYDKSDKATQMFFAETQNKLIYAVTNQTAAELIISRANAEEPNMALTSWKGSIVRKQDIFIAKNYLTESEIDTLNRLVMIFLESAELRVKKRIDITIQFWKDYVDKILEFQQTPILLSKGKISHKKMEEQIRKTYSQFDKKRKEYEAVQADEDDLNELQELESELLHQKNRKHAQN